jgi:deoxyadenosine/deoxycytidine kinase
MLMAIQSTLSPFVKGGRGIYGQTYDGMKALVIYVRERPDLYIILSARKNLSRAEIRLIRRRRKT